MLKKHIILLWFSFQLSVINCQMTPFKPKQRRFHTATLIDSKLYILGGEETSISNISDVTLGKEFFYLDFSVPFNTQKLSWRDLSSINTVPPHAGAASVKGGANNSTLFLYGGATLSAVTDLVYTFDPQSNTWSTPKIAGVNTIKKALITGIIDYIGKMYLWGGADVTNTNNINSIIDMLILDTINFNWVEGSLINAPPPRISYGAILLPDNNIIYMGGFYGENDEKLTLDQIYIYNTIGDRWDAKTATGIVPSPRDGFSTVLGLDGQSAIIFGGSADIRNIIKLDPKNSLYVLNLNNFEWNIPTISGQIPATSRMHHKANVVGKFMVVSFGIGYDQSVESDILLLDISNNDEYIWTNNFDPTPLATSKSTVSPSPSATTVNPSDKLLINKQVMIGAIVGSSLGSILLSLGGFFLYKWYKNRRKQKNTVLIPGSESNDQRQASPINNSFKYGHEISQIPRNDYTTNEPPVLSYNNYGQGIPAANDERLSRLSSQSIDDLKIELKQEIQNLRQEILQNNEQASSSSNIKEINKNTVAK